MAQGIEACLLTVPDDIAHISMNRNAGLWSLTQTLYTKWAVRGIISWHKVHASVNRNAGWWSLPQTLNNTKMSVRGTISWHKVHYQWSPKPKYWYVKWNCTSHIWITNWLLVFFLVNYLYQFRFKTYSYIQESLSSMNSSVQFKMVIISVTVPSTAVMDYVKS